MTKNRCLETFPCQAHLSFVLQICIPRVLIGLRFPQKDNCTSKAISRPTIVVCKQEFLQDDKASVYSLPHDEEKAVVVA